MQKIILTIFIIISVKIYAQNTSNDYYPIEVGYEWKYKEPDKGYEEKYIVNSFDNTYDAYLAKKIIKLGDKFPITIEELLEKRNGKVLLLGSRGGLLNTDWEMSSHILMGSNPKVGQSWKNEKEGEIEEYKIIESKEVSVPAGQFEDVLVIQKIDSSVDSKSKKKKVLMKSKQYYAPNVGLIKTEYYDQDKNVYITFLELVDYKQ